jgi:hypothetical protein
MRYEEETPPADSASVLAESQLASLVRLFHALHEEETPPAGSASVLAESLRLSG